MPLDSGIARMGIFCFVFIITFASICAIIPLSMSNPLNYNNPAKKIPEVWNGENIAGYNFSDSWQYNLTYPYNSFQTFDVGGRNLKLDIVAGVAPYTLTLSHRYGFNLWYEESMNWYNKTNDKRSYTYVIWQRINSQILGQDYKNDTIEYSVMCEGLGSGSSRFTVTVLFSFNKTTYSTPEQAWYNDNLYMLVGIDSANTNYSKDIWYIISSLLTFQTYNVFGTSNAFALALNFIVAGMFYAPTVIFALAVIKEIFSNWI